MQHVVHTSECAGDICVWFVSTSLKSCIYAYASCKYNVCAFYIEFLIEEYMSKPTCIKAYMRLLLAHSDYMFFWQISSKSFRARLGWDIAKGSASFTFRLVHVRVYTYGPHVCVCTNRQYSLERLWYVRVCLNVCMLVCRPTLRDSRRSFLHSCKPCKKQHA